MASGTAKRTDPKLWDKVKAEVTRGTKGGDAGEWSARKAQLAVAEYKKAGGGYEGGKSAGNHLSQWTKEEWGTKSGEESGKTGERYLPKKARASLSDAEYARTTAAKRRDTAEGKQFSRQPADVARKTAKARDTGKAAGATAKGAAPAKPKRAAPPKAAGAAKAPARRAASGAAAKPASAPKAASKPAAKPRAAAGRKTPAKGATKERTKAPAKAPKAAAAKAAPTRKRVAASPGKRPAAQPAAGKAPGRAAASRAAPPTRRGGTSATRSPGKGHAKEVTP